MCIVSPSVMCDSLLPYGLYPDRFLCPWSSLGKNIGVGCHSLLQRILPTQELIPGLLHCRQILYPLSYQGSPCLMVGEYTGTSSLENYLELPTNTAANMCNHMSTYFYFEISIFVVTTQMSIYKINCVVFLQWKTR